MSLLEAVLLGIIQGATEFLPISSSGHLLLLPDMFGVAVPDLSLISVVHEGTLLAVLVYFRAELWAVLKGVWRGVRLGQPFENPDARLGWAILIGSIPAAAAGLTLSDLFANIFDTPRFAATFLWGTALLLLVGERLRSGRKGVNAMSGGDAILIGLFQMLALLPGISRSGSTMAAGLWRGLDRIEAARFSFLLGIPAILGAGLLSAIDLAASGGLASQLPFFSVAFGSAAVSGYFCIHFLLRWVQRHGLYIYAIYCIALSAIYFVLQG